MLSVFLLSYGNSHEHLGEIEKYIETQKAEKTLACQLVFTQHFLFSQTSKHVSVKQLDYELLISIV